ncbi:MAG TPA: RNase H family protein [Candidatus Saccharimonadales bacterium]|nr:RNase H family protein [Candidatus Saccharimonadales bacterium]
MDKEICKNCGHELEIRSTKQTAAQKKKPFYYSAYYYCPNCKKLYHSDKFKVSNGKTMSLPLEKLNGMHLGSLEPLTGKYDAEIWTDGACVYNGTPQAKAAWAFVSGETERAARVEGKQTNNVAEGLAIYYALVWAAEKNYKKIVIHTDSQISLFNLKKPASKVKMNREIFEDIEKVIADNNLEVEYVKVLGHSGDPNNERADKLANGMAAS